MRVFFIILAFTVSLVNGCGGGADNAEPASQETLNTNSIEQNIPGTGGNKP